MKKKMILLTSAAMLAVSLSFSTTCFAQDAAEKPAPKTTNTQRVSRKKTVPAPKPPTQPALEDRLDDQRAAVRRGEQREQTSAYLIDELTVTGVFKSGEGYGAFLKAVNGRTFFAYPGMPFYDGEVTSIDADQVIFQQNQPGGKKKQLVKVYDPSALRNSAIEKEQERQRKEKEEKKKPNKKETKEDSESGDTSKDE